MITIFIIIFLIFLFYLFYRKIENFKNVYINNDFYIPSEIKIEGLENKKINASNICIFKRNENKNKIIDIECITADELLSTLSLPKDRMEMVCLDNNCLDYEDLNILNGSKKFKLVSLSYHDSYKDKCIGDKRRVKLRRCGRNIPNREEEKINSLAPYSCNDKNSLDFNLVLGKNSDKNLTRGKLTDIQTRQNNSINIDFKEGHPIPIKKQMKD